VRLLRGAAGGAARRIQEVGPMLILRSRSPHAAACGFVAMLVAALGVGCGGARTGEVSGVVKLDGVPTAGLLVRFDPDDRGATDVPPSCGVTGTDGRYRLVRPGRKTGAVVGPHVVTVVTGEGVPVQAGGRPAEGAESRREVRPGENVIDLDLRSAAPPEGP
jgi:hypothetical protein